MAVATAGAAFVLSSWLGYASGANGASVALADASVTQGGALGTLRLTVSNTGGTKLNGFSVYTGVGGNYCTAVAVPATGAVLSTTCPSMGASVPVSVGTSVDPGSAVLVTVYYPGAGVFQPGRAYHIEVQAGQAVSSAGAVAVSA